MHVGRRMRGCILCHAPRLAEYYSDTNITRLLIRALGHGLNQVKLVLYYNCYFYTEYNSNSATPCAQG